MKYITFEHSYHEDNIYPPRDFHHVRLWLGGLCTKWRKYGKQEQFICTKEEMTAAESKLLKDTRAELVEFINDCLA